MKSRIYRYNGEVENFEGSFEELKKSLGFEWAEFVKINNYQTMVCDGDVKVRRPTNMYEMANQAGTALCLGVRHAAIRDDVIRMTPRQFREMFSIPQMQQYVVYGDIAVLETADL